MRQRQEVNRILNKYGELSRKQQTTRPKAATSREPIFRFTKEDSARDILCSIAEEIQEEVDCKWNTFQTGENVRYFHTTHEISVQNDTSFKNPRSQQDEVKRAYLVRFNRRRGERWILTWVSYHVTERFEFCSPSEQGVPPYPLCPCCGLRAMACFTGITLLANGNYKSNRCLLTSHQILQS